MRRACARPFRKPCAFVDEALASVLAALRPLMISKNKLWIKSNQKQG
jgi:hypothetical protein